MTVQPNERILQPWMHDMKALVYAPAQLWCEADGTVDGTRIHAGAASVAGFYVGDTRIVSQLAYAVNAQPAVPVAWHSCGKGTSLTSLIVRNIDGPTVDPLVRAEERRTLRSDGLRSDFELFSSADEDLTVECEVRVQLDMSGMQEIKGGVPSSALAEGRIVCTAGEERIDVTCGALTVGISAPGSRVRVDEALCVMSWTVTIAARGSAAVGLDVDVRVSEGAVMRSSLACAWDGVAIHAADSRVKRWVSQSLRDLDGLRMSVPAKPEDEFLAAGAPWFFTLFGRDSLWAARFLLPLTTTTAMGTLRTLAHFQARASDAQMNADPGKIMHELRSEPLVSAGAFAFDGMALPPLYYGTIDATPLWVVLLYKAWQWGACEDEVRQLLPNLKAALAWIKDYGDCDGDGFLEYADSTGHGLSNQGWKDSGDSVRWRNGDIAVGPIALCEVQGYAYQAAMLGADLLDHFHEDGAAQFRDWAGRLKERFNETFWVADDKGRYPAIALDARKRPVDAATSNIGHLLGTGILDERGVRDVVARLMGPDMLSGYGLRTMSSDCLGYWPQSYHCGSVWAHDSAVVMCGLYEEGYVDEAVRIAEGLVKAAEVFDYQIPELYSGDGNPEGPAPYPAACHPQAWSAASSVAVLGVLLGLEPGSVPHPVPSPLSQGLSIDGLGGC